MFPGKPSIVLPAVTRPRRRAEILPRQRLLDLLYDLLERKLILVVAPAGYGKTSLLIDFAHQSDIEACWYTVDRYDQDIRRFVAHFIASIARQYPHFGEVSTAALQAFENAGNNIEPVITTIVNELYEHINSHFVVVLEDFHVVAENGTINQFIARFIERVDENCHLIISSRLEVKIPNIELLLGQGKIGNVTVNDLAFTAAEAQALTLRGDKPLSKEQALTLVEKTEGWIAGILLVNAQPENGSGETFRYSRKVSRVLDAYWTCLIDDQPEDVRRFLQLTSSFDQFNARLCQNVLGTTVIPNTIDWGSMLEQILKRNLFAQPVGEQGGWIRYHSLFREHLQERLEKENPGAREIILCRLIEEYSSTQEWERAHDACDQLGDPEVTANIIEQAGPTMLKNGRLNILTQWIGALPHRLASAHPGILSLQGAIAVSGKDIRWGVEKLDKAVTSFIANNDRERLARTLVRRAIAHYSLGDYPSALRDAEEAIELAGEDQNFLAIKAQALKARGISLQCLDCGEESISNLEASLAIYQSLNDASNIATVYQELGIAYRSAGRMERANEAYRQALDYWRADDNYYRLANLLNNYGVFCHHLGQFEQAAAAFDEGLKFARLIGFLREQAFILASFGDLYADLQAYSDAEAVYEDSLALAQQIENRFLCFYLNHALACLARATGKLNDAHGLNDAATRHALPASRYEQGLLALDAGRLAMAEQRFSESTVHFATAIEQFKTGNLILEEAQSHLYMAMAWFQAGKEKDSRDHLFQAFNLSQNAKAHSLCMVSSIVEIIPLLEYFKLDCELGRLATKFLGRLRDFEGKLPEVRRRLRKNIIQTPPVKPKVVIRAFGGVHLTINDAEYSSPDWKSPTQREIVFYLLHHPEGASKSRLLELFWGNDRSGPNQLSNLLYKMHRALGEELVVYRNERYYFNRNLDYEYDVEQFLWYRDQVSEATSPDKRAEFQIHMMRLYRGVFLPESEGVWVVPEQERLRQIFMETVLALGEHHLMGGEYSKCLEDCWQAIEHEANSEGIYRLAMRAAAAMGDRGNVNYFYRLYERISRKTDNYGPSLETDILYRQLTG